MKEFPSIKPGGIDDFTFDLTNEVGASTVAGAVWTCVVSPSSTAADPAPATRLIGIPTWNNTSTTHRFGNAVEGVAYWLKADVTLADGRVIPAEGEVVCLGEPLTPVIPQPPGLASFNYEDFVTRFPSFDGVSPETLEALWNQATLFWRNDGTGPVTDVQTQTMLLYMLTAHLAQRYAGPGGASGMVGRINSKSVNGVSVSSEGFGVNGTEGWWLTTQYGTDFWRATGAYRLFRYVPGPQRFPSVWPFRTW